MGMPGLQRKTLGLRPIDFHRTAFGIEAEREQSRFGQMVLNIGTSLQAGKTVIGNQAHQCIVQIDMFEDTADARIDFGINAPDGVHNFGSFFRIVMTALGINSAVKNMLNMINGSHPAEGHVPINLFEPICGGLGPPVILGRELIKVKIDINPAVHIGPGVIDFNIRAGRRVELFRQFRRQGDLLGGVNGALIEFK